jgi:hypothetical protein
MSRICKWCTDDHDCEADKEIARLRALLRRHDDLCRKDEKKGLDHLWTPALKELAMDTRRALKEEKS